MKIDEKSNDEARAAYLIACAQRRAKIVVENRVVEGEIMPVNGVLTVSLGAPISKEHLAELLIGVPHLIDIPEVRQYASKSK